MFFLDGPGGTGKTFVENLLLAYVRSHNGLGVALAVASSGIASLLLMNGRTAYSRFRIPIQLDDQSSCNISNQSDLAKLFRETDLIIWDEAPAQNRRCFEVVNKMLQEVRDCDEWFGGAVVVFAGISFHLLS
jgi:PIF1-like helicase